MNKYLAALLLAIAVAWTNGAYAQSVPLSFRPLDSSYSKPLDRIIMISANPDQLHIYDPPTNSDILVNLSKAPLNLSVSPDGTHAAVMHDSLVSYVNLSTARVEKTFAVAATKGQVVLTPDSVYVLVGGGNSAISILLSTGGISTDIGFFASDGAFNAQLNSIYATENQAAVLWERNLAAASAVEFNNPFSRYYPACTGTWFSPDGSRLYNGCGTVFRASADRTIDTTYLTSFPGLAQIQSLDSSVPLKLVAAIPASSPGTNVDSEIRLFESGYLKQIGHFALPDFTVGGNDYKAHGKTVFFNNVSSELYVLAEADSSSGLLNDFAVQSISLGSPDTCSATLGTFNANAIASGEIQAVTVTAPNNCALHLQSDVPWIEIIEGQYLSGNLTTSYRVRPNLTSQPRSGTLSVGTATFTVTQAAAISASPFNRLSFNVSVADYSKTLNKLVLGSSDSNELHIYDPISQTDQAVSLVREPLALSGSPDGTHVAVGHYGWVSYVNLQTASVEQVFPVSLDVAAVILGGTGYIYLFPAPSSFGVQSLEIATGTLTPSGGFEYDGGTPRLTSAGTRFYGGRTWIYEYNVSGGLAQPVNRGSINLATCGNLWLSEDENQLFTACGWVFRTSEVPADDLEPMKSLTNATAVTWAANSAANGLTAVIPANPILGSFPDDTELQLYSNADLTLVNRTNLPSFSVDANQYAGHGQFAFWDASGSKLFTILQADTTAGLHSSSAIYTFTSFGTPSACATALSSTSFHASASIASASTNIAVNPFCPWSVQSDSSWITPSVTSGVGSAQLTFSVAVNSTGITRSGTLNIAGNIFTITQDGATTLPASEIASIDFGPQTITVPSAPQFISIGNSGEPFTLSVLFITDGNFIPQKGSCEIGVPNYKPCNLAVTFTPYAYGPRHGALEFDLNGSPIYVQLSGLGSGLADPLPEAFEIRNRLSGKVLDVTNFSTEPGTLIQQWDAVGSDNQKWFVIPQTDGYYKIQSELSGKVLDVRNFSTDNGAAIQQWDDAGSDNQRWSITSVDGQYYEIANKLSGKALDVTNFSIENGAPLQQWEYGATQNQQWDFIPIANIGVSQNPTLPSGYVTIVNRHSAKVLDVTNFSSEDGTQIQQWDYASTKNQQWQLEPVNADYYKIVNRLSGKVLDVRDFSTKNGAAIQQWDYEQSDNQLWTLAPVDGKYFKIVNKLSGLVLDMTDFSTDDGGKLQQWQDSGSQNQEWSFSQVSD